MQTYPAARMAKSLLARKRSSGVNAYVEAMKQEQVTEHRFTFTQSIHCPCNVLLLGIVPKPL